MASSSDPDSNASWRGSSRAQSSTFQRGSMVACSRQCDAWGGAVAPDRPFGLAQDAHGSTYVRAREQGSTSHADFAVTPLAPNAINLRPAREVPSGSGLEGFSRAGATGAQDHARGNRALSIRRAVSIRGLRIANLRIPRSSASGHGYSPRSTVETPLGTDGPGAPARFSPAARFQFPS